MKKDRQLPAKQGFGQPASLHKLDPSPSYSTLQVFASCNESNEVYFLKTKFKIQNVNI